MRDTPKDVTLAQILVGLVALSLLGALTGLSLQLAGLGKPLGTEGALVGDVSTGVFLASSLATFVFAARLHDREPRRPGSRRSSMR